MRTMRYSLDWSDWSDWLDWLDLLNCDESIHLVCSDKNLTRVASAATLTTTTLLTTPWSEAIAVVSMV
jgi:hypothetical protein